MQDHHHNQRKKGSKENSKMNYNQVEYLLVFHQHRLSSHNYLTKATTAINHRRSNNNTLSQMSVVRKSINLLTIIAVIISTATLIINNQNVHVDAGLIQIYNKYRPKLNQSPPSSSSSSQEVSSSSSHLSSPHPSAVTQQASTLIDTFVDHLNTSSSAPLEQYEEFQQQFHRLHHQQRQRQQQQAPTQPEVAVEYSSPMKRIMELISHHSPVMVVQDSHQDQQKQSNSILSSQQQQFQHQPTAKADSGNVATFIHQSTGIPSFTPSDNQQQPLLLNQVASTTSDHQQWALLDGSLANHMMQPILTAQPQQLIQTATPYEQYYISPSHLNTGDHGHHHQITVIPANVGFSSANSYQQIATNPYSSPIEPQPQPQTLPHQIHHQKQQLQIPLQHSNHHHHNSLEDRAQPVFLSSYVPEVNPQQQQRNQQQQTADKVLPTNQIQQHSDSNNQQAKTSTDQRPGSIQQIQNSQVQRQSSTNGSANGQLVETINKTSPSSKESSDTENEGNFHSIDSDNDNDSPNTYTKSPPDEPDYVDSNNDLEEPNKIRRSHDDQAKSQQTKQQQQPGNDEQDDPASEGSMTFEDKYDSDKDEPRSVSLSIKDPKKSEPNMVATNGLVTVGLNEDCLQCICRASSGCDDQLRCITRGSDEKYCGPFQLTEEYWQMAGSPGDSSNNFLSYEDCANDADCAVETVTNYMKKYGKDCDDDQLITCMDFARLHRLKPNECRYTERLNDKFDAYWPKFQRCAEGYNRSRTGDDEDI